MVYRKIYEINDIPYYNWDAFSFIQRFYKNVQVKLKFFIQKFF